MNKYQPAVPYETILYKQLRIPERAASYLEINLDGKDKKFFLIALRNIVESRSGILELSRMTKLSRPNLYRIMSEKGNPEIMTLNKILNVLGLRLSVVVLRKSKNEARKKLGGKK